MKPPAFQFYPKDFLTDGKTMMMPNDVLGIYVRLLCFDWVDDGLPENTDLWRRLVAFEEPDDDIGYGRSWEDVMTWIEHMFVEHPNKAHYVTNPRLQIEREGQAERRKKRIEAGRESGRVRKSQAISNSSSMNNAEVLFEQTTNKRRTKTNSSSASSSASAIMLDPNGSNIPPHTPNGVFGGAASQPTPLEPKKIPLAPKLLITELEHEKLLEEFGSESVKYYTQVCSDYLLAKGRVMKSPAAFMRNWIRRDIAECKGFYYHKFQNGVKTQKEKNLEYFKNRMEELKNEPQESYEMLNKLKLD